MSRNLNETIKNAKNFKYKDIINSSTAKSRKIDNSPTNEEIWVNAEYLAEKCLQPARDHFNAPLIINSWYRSPSLNKAVGGSPTSFHSFGMAADVVFGERGHDLIDLFKFFHENKLYTELIAEEIRPGGGWIHVALAKGREKENQLKYKLSGKPVKRGTFEEILNIFK